MMMRAFHRKAGAKGFTLVELMMVIAMMGIIGSTVALVFINGWRLWKQNYDEMRLQRDARMAMARMVQAVREARAGTIVISKPPNGGTFSQLSFTDGRGRAWKFWQDGLRLYAMAPLASGITTTDFMCDSVQAVQFVTPNFADRGLLDVGMTLKTMPYRQAARPILVQIAERVMVRNP